MEGHYGYRRILKELWPMVLMLMVTSVYSIVDGWFISNYAGSTAFASMNIIWPAIAIISALGLMVGAGKPELVNPHIGLGLDGSLICIDEARYCLPVCTGPASNLPQAGRECAGCLQPSTIPVSEGRSINRRGFPSIQY